MTREESPLHARAAHPGCPACGGTGRVHIQHKRPFRVESRECDCWRVVELADECDRLLAVRRQLQGDAP